MSAVPIDFHIDIAVDPRSPNTNFGPGDEVEPSEAIACSDDWLAIICDRFGVSPDVFASMLVVQGSKKSVDLVNRDHRPPKRPRPDSSGMKCIHTTMAYPKVTTQAAMLLGRHATRNVLEVSRSQADAYLHRRDFEVDSEQLSNCTGTGYLLVSHDDHVMGVGFFRPAERREPGRDGSQPELGLVRSMYPKSAALPDNVSAFD